MYVLYICVYDNYITHKPHVANWRLSARRCMCASLFYLVTCMCAYAAENPLFSTRFTCTCTRAYAAENPRFGTSGLRRATIVMLRLPACASAC